MSELLYNDDTKLRDLTVGQLKDLIIELLAYNQRFPNYVNRGYFIDKEPFNPNEPYCSGVKENA